MTFAIYSETDFSLDFYNRDATPAVGDLFENKIVTKIYTNISAATPAWVSDKTIKNITSSTVVDVIAPTRTSQWYNGGTSITSINLANLDTSNVTDMNYMFGNCSLLESLDCSNLNTSNVTNLRCLFYNCGNLTSIDVSNFDTSSVTNFEYVFYNCLQANIIGVDKWDTSSGTTMKSMFYKCASTPVLDLSGWDTSNVTDMSWMFNRGAGQLIFTGWDTSKVTTFKGTFSASYFTYLDLSSFNVSSVEDFNSMFFASESLKTILVSYNWNESFKNENVVTDWMFENCFALMGDLAYSDLHETAPSGSTEHMEGNYATTENGYLTLKYEEENSEDNEAVYNRSYMVQGVTLHNIAEELRKLLGTPQKIALKNFSKILEKQINAAESATLTFKDKVHSITDDVSVVASGYFTNTNLTLQTASLNKFYLIPTIIKGSIFVFSDIVNLTENSEIIYSGDITRLGNSLAFIINGDAIIQIVPKQSA